MGTDRRCGHAPAYGAVMVAGTALHVALPSGPAAAVTYCVLGATTALVVLLAIRHHQPARPGPWRSIAAALGVTAAADTAWFTLGGFGGDPSLVSPLYLLAYGFAVAALLALVRTRSPRAGSAAVLDTAIVTTGVAVLVWAFVLHPAWTYADGDLPRLMAAVFPVVSLVLLALVARLAFGGGQTPASLRWMGAGMTLLLGVHLLEALPGASGPYDAPRLLATAAFGLAALHPSMRHITEPGEPTGHRLHRWRLVALWAASVAAPLTLLIELGRDDGGRVAVISLGSVTLFTLVVARMWGLLGTVREMVDRQHEDRFRALIEHADDVVMIVHPERGLSYVSPTVGRVWGYSIEQLRRRHRDLVAPEDRARFEATLADVTRQPDGVVARFEGRVRHADGDWRHVAVTFASHTTDPAIDGVVITARDVTTQRELELQLTHQAFHDPLTELPNRALFTDRVRRALESPASDRFTAVLFLDLDDFKTVNDGLGHGTGDQLLRIVAGRLARSVRPEDTVARFGGDEFAVLLPRASSLDAVTTLAERLLTDLAEPVSLSHRRVEPRVSIGIATSHGEPSAEALLRDADAAMYVAKRAGKATFQVFDPTMHADAVRRLQLKMDLQLAAERGELRVVYQTIQTIDAEDVVGIEALLRWDHPARGPVRPDEFIALAEETGSIEALGSFVLTRACADAARYRSLTGADVFVTVNVSPVQVAGPALTDAVREALVRSGLPPSRLVLELTESVFIADDGTVADNLHALAALGVQLAIDDFGSGYCSLAYLQRFRFDVVKVDKAFIDVLAEPDGDPRLTVGILDLIASLGVPAVAEGIETPAQLEALRAIGCAFGQGYLWSRPVPVHELPAPATVRSLPG